MPRSVGLVDAVAVLVGVTIGSGIFRVPATVAGTLHAPGAVILCWVLGGLIALCGALTVAELAGALPRSGGIFAWLLEAFGPMPRSSSLVISSRTISRPLHLPSPVTQFARPSCRVVGDASTSLAGIFNTSDAESTIRPARRLLCSTTRMRLRRP